MRPYAARITAAALALAAAAIPARAQLVNGSLTGPIHNNGVPSGWSIFLETPDTMDEGNNVGIPGLTNFSYLASPSPDGGTWVGIGRNSTTFVERFGQTVHNFIPGESYTVAWYGANFGTAGYDHDNAIQVLLDGASIGTGASLIGGWGWLAQSLGFTATGATHTLAFQLANDPSSYISIDGIAIRGNFAPAAPVVSPEPATLALVGGGLALLGAAARRRGRLA